MNFDWSNIAAVVITNVAGAISTGVVLYKKYAPRVKLVYGAALWIADHLKENSAAQLALADIEAAATAQAADNADLRDVHIKAAVHDFLAATKLEAAQVTPVQLAAASKFVADKVPEPFRSVVTQEVVSSWLQTIAANAADDAQHEAIQAAQRLQ